MTKYLKIGKWDMLLCAIMTFALSITVFAGFDATDTYRQNLLFLILGSAILTVLWFLVFYSRRTILIGAAVAVAAFIVILAIARSNGVNLFADQEGNPYFRFVLMIAAAFAAVLLSRFRVGSIFLFAFGIFLICFIEFMYENRMVIPLLLFLGAAGIMIMYRNYMTNVLNSMTVQIAPGRSVLMALIMVILVTAVAGAVYYGVVRPFNPPSRDVKILTKYMSLEVLEKIGVADVNTIHDLQQNASDNQKEDMTVSKSSDQEKDDSDNNQDGKAKNKNQLEREEWIKYHRDLLIGGIPVLIVAVIAAVILVRLFFRKRKYKKMMQLDIAHRIPAFYQYFLNCFRCVGIHRRPDETPYEFADRAAKQVRDFEAEGCGLVELTETLVAVKYGLRPVSTEEIAGYDAFYKGIFKCCRKRLGFFKYLFYFFKI